MPAAELPADVPDDNDRTPVAPDPRSSPPPHDIPEVGGDEPPPGSPGRSDLDPSTAGEPTVSETATPSQPDTPAASSQQGTSTSSRHKPSRRKGASPAAPKREPTIPTPAQINQTATLLRRVFSLRLQVWALQGAHVLDRPVQVERAREAEKLLREVKRVVEEWAAVEGGWSAEEREEVVCIGRLVGELEGGVGGQFWGNEGGH